MSGWGAFPWGAGAWGVGGEGLRLLSAVPIRENVVRLAFSAPPLMTGLLDPRDASDPRRYSTAALASVGADGLPARPVSPVLASPALVEGSGGRMIDVTVDRPFSPAPARYLAAVNGLVSADGEPLTIGATSAEFDGLSRGRPAPRGDLAVGRRDVAAVAPAGAGGAVALPVDGSGDYAFEEGAAGYRKRVRRRVVTRRGAFAHLPAYGVGTADQIKRLARQSVRVDLVAEAEEQIGLEPETRSVRASVEPEPGAPGAYRMKLKITAATGETFELVAPLRA